MHAARPENLTSRTAVDISYPIIGKSLITKNSVVISAVGFYPGVSHVRGDPARLALHEVFSRSILVIGDHDLGLAIGILLVLIHQPHKLLVLCDGTRRCLKGGNDPFPIINRPVMFIARS